MGVVKVPYEAYREFFEAGLDDEDIAQSLKVTTRTVRTYRSQWRAELLANPQGYAVELLPAEGPGGHGSDEEGNVLAVLDASTLGSLPYEERLTYITSQRLLLESERAENARIAERVKKKILQEAETMRIEHTFSSLKQKDLTFLASILTTYKSEA